MKNRVKGFAEVYNTSEKCGISAMFMWLLDCGRNVVNVVHKK